MAGGLGQRNTFFLEDWLAIHEDLDLPDVYKVYGSLAEIARARGDEAAAAKWQAKRDAKVAELKRLRGGGGEAYNSDCALAGHASSRAIYHHSRSV